MRVRVAYSKAPYSSLTYFHSLLHSHIENKISTSPLFVLRELLNSNAKPNDFTFSLLLKAFTSSALNTNTAKLEVNVIHTQLVKSGFDQLVYLSTALLDLYMRRGSSYVDDAEQVFDYMPHRDVVSWNALISGYLRNAYDFDALRLFPRMLKEGVRPSHTTVATLLPCCGRSEFVVLGGALHGFAFKAGLDVHSQVNNALCFMYAKFANLDAAELLFEEMVVRGVDSWNTMISAYGQNGFYNRAVVLFRQMLMENVEPNSVTIMSLLSASAYSGSIHCFITKTGIDSDACMITSLICAYAKCGNLQLAELLLKSLPQRNLISSTAIISSYAEKGKVDMVVKHFTEMCKLDIKLDAIAMVSILQGFKDCSHFNIGLAFHCYVLKTGLSADYLVTNGLIGMYSKFSEIKDVFSLFSEMHGKPLTCWNLVIAACMQAGRPGDALELFRLMRMSGHSPDAFTVASLLAACSQQGYLQLGARLHNYILRNNIEVEDVIGTALIDLYSKCGSIVHAEMVFKSIKNPCVATWNAMISGYSLCGREVKAISCFSKMRENGLEPDDITFLGILSACTHGGFIREGLGYFQIMREEYGIVPNLQHYACIISLFSRAGLFEEAMIFIKNMEVEPDFAVWAALLNACCIHHEVKLGECLAKKLFFLDCNNGGFFVLMSNLYAAKGRWSDVARVREMMRDAERDGCSGISIVEVSSLQEINENLCLSELNANFGSDSFTN